MKLTAHFDLDEFTGSQTAIRRGIANDPPPEAVDALRVLCERVLEPLRAQLGRRGITITSGYRSPLLNQAIGGSRTSQHVIGEAADIKVPGLTAQQVFDLLRASDLPFDQLILEFGQWVHVSCSRNQTRQQCLIAHRTARGVQYANAPRRPATQVPPPPKPPTIALAPSAAQPLPITAPVVTAAAPEVVTPGSVIGLRARVETVSARVADALLGSGKRETGWAGAALLAWPLWNELAQALASVGFTLPTTKGQWLTIALAVGRLLVLRFTK